MPILDKANTFDVKRYHDFVRNSDFTNVTQDIQWSLVKKDWKNQQVYIEKQNKIIAAMSLLIKPIGKYSMLYAPRGPVCDVYNINIVNELIAEVDKVAEKYNAFMLRFDPEVKYDKNLEDEYRKLGYKVRNKGYDKNHLIQPRYNMILDIENATEEDVMNKFSSKTRYNIRLANRKGVKVNYYRSIEALEIFFKLYEIMAARNKIQMRSFEYFKAMLDAYNQYIRIYIAEHEGDYLSAAIAINYGRKVFYIYGGSSNEKRNLMPNYAMQWEMIKWGIETGAKKYDFGGVFQLDKSDGLYRFKEGFCYADGVTELIGEIDKVYKPIPYYGFVKLVPKLQWLKKKLNRNRTK